jgi:hypothetical protein
LQRRRPGSTERKAKAMQKSDHTVRGDFLVNAFHHAWLRALQDELVTSDNVASAPAELMQALLVALDEVADRDAPSLGKAAYAKWCSQPVDDDMDAPGPDEWVH